MDNHNAQTPTLQVKQFYSGKNIFITGCTGFLGKVILEKLLRTCPDIGNIFVMIRAKRNSSLQERVRDDILSSQCFTVLKQQLGGQARFVKFAMSKIVPISGDLINERLGISDADREMCTSKVNVIINSAASVNFNDPLKVALQINYFGSQKVLELAKECKHLDIYTQVSTAYVNCNRLGYIEEKLYNPTQDVSSLVKEYMSMSDLEVKEQQNKIIGNFPNTYTFTKNLAEKSLVQNIGNLKCVIWRPSIIASAVKEPFPGWTDQLSAAGSVTIMGGLGILPYLQGAGLNTVDMIPVDFVSNGLLVATAHGAQTQGQSLHIYNCGSSVQNPLTIGYYCKFMVSQFEYLKLNDQKFRVSTEMIESQFEFDLRKKVFEEYPLKTFEFISKLPFIGSPQLQKQASGLLRQSKNINRMIQIFDKLMKGDWHYENKKIYDVLNMMSLSERAEFACDCRELVWDDFLVDFLKGMVIWCLKENQVAPQHNLKQIVYKQTQPFSLEHTKDTFKYQKNLQYKTSQDYEKSILSQSRFNEYLEHSAKWQVQKVQVSSQHKNDIYEPNAIKSELARLRCVHQKTPSQFAFYLSSKIIHRLVEGLHIDQQGIENVRKLCQNRKTRVILMPMYRSFGDPILQHYINYLSELDMGFTFAMHEDQPNIQYLNNLVKRNGVFLMKRKQPHNVNINYVNQALIQEAIENNSITTIFQNDERPRSGKFSVPQNPDNIIKLLLKAHQRIRKHKYDIKIIPVCVNQDGIFDINYITSETENEFNPGTSLFNMLQTLYAARPGKCGQVYVNYGDPIDLDQYVEKFKSQQVPSEQTKLDFQSLAMKLTKDLYSIQQKQQPVTMNSMIAASIMINYQQDKITFKTIKSTTKSLYEHVLTMNHKTYCSAPPENYDIYQAALNLGFKVEGDALDKKKGNKALVVNSDSESINSKLALSYYANQLSAFFSLEAIITHAVCYQTNFNDPTSEQKTTSLEEVFLLSKFLQDLLRNEFITQEDDLTIEKTKELLEHGEDFNMYNLSDLQNISVNPDKKMALKIVQMKDLLQCYIDLYLVVAQALYVMSEKGLALELPNLSSELNRSIQELHHQGSIKFMQSCLRELIDNSIQSYINLGLGESQSYSTRRGESTVYIKIPASNAGKLSKYLQVLTGMSSLSGNIGHQKKLEKECDNAIILAQGLLGKL